MFNLRNFKIFASSAETLKLNRFEDQILELVERSKALEIDVKNSDIKLKQLGQEHEFKLREAKKQHEMDVKEALQKFELEKDSLKQDLLLEKKRGAAEIERVRLEQEHSFKLKEKELLAQKQIEIQKLTNEKELDVRQAKMDAQKAADAQIAEATKKLLQEREEWLEKNHEKMNNSMIRLHEKGNSSTEFIQKLSLAMLDRAPNVNRLDISTGGNPPARQILEVEKVGDNA